METPEYLHIIEDAKKYVFVENMMSYFMISSGFKPDFRIPIPKRCYRLIPKAFNDVIKISMTFLFSRISVFNTFRSFEANEMRNIGTFILFASTLQDRYFSDGYNPQRFLYFCSHLAYMAISFYDAGETDFPKLTVSYIVTALKMYEVPESKFWNGLNIAALGYVKIALKCGFVRMSDFESMKIQFVLNQSFQEQTADDDDLIVEGRATNTVQQDFLKLSAELNSKLSMIDDYSAYNKNKQNKTEIETHSLLYEEGLCLVLLSDPSSTNPKESSEIGMENKSINENKLDTECVGSPTIISVFKKNPRKYRIFQVLFGLENRPDICAYPESCGCLFDTNSDCSSEDIVIETSGSLKSESNVTSIKNDATESTEKDSKYLELKQKIQSSKSVTHCQNSLPRISGEKYSGYFAANEPLKTSPNSASNEETFSSTDKESARRYISEEFLNAEESDTEDCVLETVDFDICDRFVVDVAMRSGTEIELYGETYESFMSNEDYFNSTFDILSVSHHMAINLGTKCLNVLIKF